MKRRDLLARGGALAAGTLASRLLPACSDADLAPAAAPAGAVRHILPTASHDRILLKVSLAEPAAEPPRLAIGRRRIAGLPTGTSGRFFAFDATDLEPGTRYELSLLAGSSGATHLIDPWELSTAPALDARPERLRILAYTCAGGHDFLGYWLSAATRRRLLRRALARGVDVVVANGDHVYWDLVFGTTAASMGQRPDAIAHVGEIDRAAPVLGSPNEAVLERIVGPQIVDVYGTELRSTPVFFLRDDHDYFENDYFFPGESGAADRASFPPDGFSLAAARASQWLYYPEFLPDPFRRASLPASGAADRPPGVGEAFGTLRWGELLEMLLYDCKGFMSLTGADAGLVPPAVERWLLERTAGSSARHVVHAPSNPPGWTAGKWAEWYPDVLAAPNVLTIDEPKPGWQPGWLRQHDRLLAAASAQRRIPLFVSGDLHDSAEGAIRASLTADFSANPVNVIVSGTLGTSVGGWPSSGIRQTRALPPIQLDVEETLVPVEQNGFHILEVEPDRISVETYVWDAVNGSEEEIDTLEPMRVSVLA